MASSFGCSYFSSVSGLVSERFSISILHTQAFFSSQGHSCHRLDSQEPRQKRSATAFGNVCLYEPTGWLEGKNNILRKLGQLIPADWGRSGQACLMRAQRASLAQEERTLTEPSSQHTFCCPLSPGPEPALGLCYPSLQSHPSLSESTTPGMTHRVMMELLLHRVPLARPARRAVPGGPREAVYIVGTVI